MHLGDMECDVNPCANVNKCYQAEEISLQSICCQTHLNMETIKKGMKTV